MVRRQHSQQVKTTIESEIGPISGEYDDCIHKQMQGTFYAGSNGICFKGKNFVFLPWRGALKLPLVPQSHTVLKWESVSSIERTDEETISLVLADGTESFSLLDSEKVWATLVSLHRERNGRLAPIKASLRRLNMDEAAYVAAATLSTMDDVRTMRGNTTPSMLDITGDLEQAWKDLNKQIHENYSEIAIKDKVFCCSLERFFDLFFADDAPHSMERFLRDSGDDDLITTPWKKDGGYYTRTIEYSHPVNAPLAPPVARARKEQRYRRFGKRGISIETDTYVDDVPMTDCFFVTDRVLVAAKGHDRVVVTAQFDIRFVKTTLFRAIIANTTRSEFRKMNKQFFAHVQNNTLGEDNTKTKTLLPTPTIQPPQRRVPSSILLLLLLLFQLVLMLQLHSMQQAMQTQEWKQHVLLNVLREKEKEEWKQHVLNLLREEKRECYHCCLEPNETRKSLF